MRDEVYLAIRGCVRETGRAPTPEEVRERLARSGLPCTRQGLWHHLRELGGRGRVDVTDGTRIRPLYVATPAGRLGRLMTRALVALEDGMSLEQVADLVGEPKWFVQVIRKRLQESFLGQTACDSVEAS